MKSLTLRLTLASTMPAILPETINYDNYDSGTTTIRWFVPQLAMTDILPCERPLF
ncbi:MAG TPA: hypothetical protein PLK08_10240 [Phycisphaerae bacterium]|nr:hypothetical protein [Phycisphaerae bacterium]